VAAKHGTKDRKRTPASIAPLDVTPQLVVFLVSSLRPWVASMTGNR
jgi:hypothetical protein